jgi:NAD(P)-dependent dehydrogenase (short-subunit alcohol dehydrogenase family)
MSALLQGQAAFVTGGAQGIGLAVAKAFLREGASVTIADVLPEALEAAQRSLEKLGPSRSHALRLDVADEAATEAAADEAIARHGRMDVVVANAGILVLKPAVELSTAEWRRVLDVNLTGAFLTSTVFARRLVRAGTGGRIVLTSSLFGLRGGVENAAYSASKFGMVGLMQCLAAELAPHGIRVNCVCPGQMDTAMLQRLFEERAASQNKSAENVRQAFVARIPLGRLGPLDELADTYVYLASDLSRYVTGQSIVVDGGWQVG